MPPTTEAPARPALRELTLGEIEEVLRRNAVGRLAYTAPNGQVAIEPLNYVYDAGGLVGRTSPGSKLSSLWQRPSVSFEVDEVDGPLDWRSVVIQGVFHRVPPGDSPAARKRYEQTLGRIRTIDPGALTGDDPVPSRSVLFRIPIAEVSGRAARTAPTNGQGHDRVADEMTPPPTTPVLGEETDADRALERAAQELAESEPWYAGLVQRLLGFSLFWKIMVANGLIVVLAAVIAALGTPGTATVGERLWGLGPLVLGGLAVTLVLNAAILQLALHPLRVLTDSARRVAEGDLSARAAISPLADRDVARLARTLNHSLERVQRSQKRLRALAGRAMTNAEADRTLVSRDLQDEAAQSLAGVLMHLKRLRGSVPEEHSELIEATREAVSDTIERLRSWASYLRPATLDLLGVGAAIEAYAQECGLRARFQLDTSREPLRGSLSPEAELALFRVAQEALDNVVEHADAHSLRLRIRQQDDQIHVRLEDDGRGFPLSSPLHSEHAALGLYGMQETAAYFGGSVRFESRPRSGTTVDIRFPFLPRDTKRTDG